MLFCQCIFSCHLNSLTLQQVQVAHVQRHHPPAAAGGGGGITGSGVRGAHARHDQVLPVEDVVHGAAHQGHDGRRGHQAVEVHAV